MTNRVCVVGGASSLYGSKLGKVIDSYPVVVRVSSCPIEGYEEDVGEKVTIQTGNITHMGTNKFHVGRGMGEYWGITMTPANMPTPVRIWDFDNVHGDVIQPPKASFRLPVLNEESAEWEKEFLAQHYATTGFKSVALALHMYPTAGIDIVGFGPPNRLEKHFYFTVNDPEKRKEQASAIWDKFYDKDGNTILNVHPDQHDLNKERCLLNLWQSRGLLTRLEGAVP